MSAIIDTDSVHSDSSNDLEDFVNVWNIPCKKANQNLVVNPSTSKTQKSVPNTPPKSNEKETEGECSVLHSKIERNQKLANLSELRQKIQEGSLKCQKKTDERRFARLLRKQKKKDSTEEHLTTSKKESPKQETWSDVKQFLTVNDHLTGPVSHGGSVPQNKLEIKIHEALLEGEVNKAEELSDQLANRDFAVKIADAFAAKRYSKELEVQKEKEKAKQIKKLKWGFEAKERWEMKGNM